MADITTAYGKLSDTLRSLGVECFAVLPYSECHEINRSIIERGGITPRTAIIYLLPYYHGDTVNLSRYAASIDYHIVISQVNSAVCSLLSELFPDSSTKGYGDHSPIDECSAAIRAGLGVRGKNGLLINEKYGSYIFIGDLLTDIPAESFGVTTLHDSSSCIGCSACIKACPTGILRGESDQCLSAITQRKGELEDWERELMIRVGTVWGCDVCQSVCPCNRDVPMTPVKGFANDRIPHLTSEILSSMDKAEFSRRAFAWRGRKTVERNLQIYENRTKIKAETEETNQ